MRLTQEAFIEILNELSNFNYFEYIVDNLCVTN